MGRRSSHCHHSLEQYLDEYIAAGGVIKRFAEAKQRFPDDVDYSIPVDTTRAVNEGIKEIVETLLIAIALMVAVVYVFLQGWRSR